MPQSCALCGLLFDVRVGVGCERCVGRLHRHETVVSGLVRSSVAPSDARAYLIDPFGMPHPLRHRSDFGRAGADPTPDVEVPISTVSRRQGRIAYQGCGRWTLENLGQIGGVSVGGGFGGDPVVLGTSQVVDLTPLDVVTLAGHVSLMFWPQTLPIDPPARPLSLPTRKRALRYRVTRRAGAWIVVYAQADDGESPATIDVEGGVRGELSPGRWNLLHCFIARRTSGDVSAYSVRSLVGKAGRTEMSVRRRMSDLRNALEVMGAAGIVCATHYRLHADCVVRRLER